MNDTDVEAIERATLAAVAPETVDEWDDWLLPFDHGTIGRAKAAVPLRHAEANENAIEAIEARYRERGLPTVFRIADLPCFETLTGALQLRGYVDARAAFVRVGAVARMRAVSVGAPADVDDAPDAAWTDLFLGEGFDPIDGANRVKALSRGVGTRYASVRDTGRTLAGGALSISHGWASVHGMRTEQAHRGRGLAGRVLADMAEAAAHRGFERVFLQVEAGNTAAHALYRRAGFEPAWAYRYWQRPA